MRELMKNRLLAAGIDDKTVVYVATPITHVPLSFHAPFTRLQGIWLLQLFFLLHE
jgi:hypothetical protein